METWQVVIGNSRGVVDLPRRGRLDIRTAAGRVVVAELYSVPPQANRSPASTRHEEYGVRLLRTDLRIGLYLLDNARARAAARVFGVPEDQSMLVSVIAAGVLAHAVHSRAKRLFVGPGGPTVADATIGLAVLREATHLITGDQYKDTPIFGSLVALAVTGSLVRPLARETARRFKDVSGQARTGFDHRYGHLFRR